MEKNFLIISNLTKIYDSNTPRGTLALKNVNLSIKEGEFVTFLGSNAAGKSTLLNIIIGAMKPSQGDIILDGQLISNIPEYLRAKFITCVRQNPNESIINSMTVAENLTMVKIKNQTPTLSRGLKEMWRKEFISILKPFNIGLENKLDEQMCNLSGGQKQTISLLMATLVRPKLLLLDEHTAALDPKVSKSILKITNDIVKKKKVTTLMITHNIHQALKYGNRLIIFNRGEVVLDISKEEKKHIRIKQIEKYYVNDY